ncbi:MAG: DUF1045 domain-containing protein [Proteobacteria bacterium]|nr:DUF1045 domain-containing protein [Pseudomonadota bacterium]
MEMRVGITLMPNRGFIGDFIKIQRKLKRFVDIRPSLGRNRNIPHITLMQGTLSGDIDYRHLLEQIKEYLIESKAERVVKLKDLEYVEIGWLFLMLEREDWLVKAHHFALESIKPHLLPGTVADWQKFDKYSQLEKENYLRYGYRYVNDAFRPHITLGKLPNARSPDIATRIESLYRESRLDKRQGIESITVCVVGEYGSHEKALDKLSL